MHLPLLRNPDRSKLSKRKNPTGILFYQRMGYLPEALLELSRPADRAGRRGRGSVRRRGAGRSGST